MPDWLIPIFQQFPVVALCLVAMRIVLKWADDRHRDELGRVRSELDAARARADAEIARVRQDQDRSDQNHRAELARAEDLYTKQLTKLRTRVRELERAAGLGGAEGET